MGKGCCVITINNIVIYVISLKLKYIIFRVKMALISVEGKNQVFVSPTQRGSLKEVHGHDLKKKKKKADQGGVKMV